MGVASWRCPTCTAPTKRLTAEDRVTLVCPRCRQTVAYKWLNDDEIAMPIPGQMTVEEFLNDPRR